MRVKFWILLTLLMGILLTACAQQKSASPEAEPTKVSSSETALPTQTIVPTEVSSTDYCVECHMDKEMLISTAKVEEEVEEESEGVG